MKRTPLINSLRSDLNKRERLFSATLLLGTFAALPLPTAALDSERALTLVALWAAVGTLAWAAYFRPNWVAGLWLVSFMVASTEFWKNHLVLPWLLLVLYAVWRGFRSSRVKQLAIGFVFLAVAPSVDAQQPAPAESYALPSAPPATPETATPTTTGSTPLPNTPVVEPKSESAPRVSQPAVDAPADIVVPVDQSKQKAAVLQKQRDELNATLKPPTDIKLTREQKIRRAEAIKEFRKSREELKNSVPKAGDFKKESASALPQPPNPDKVVIPKYMNGYSMADIHSCAVIDRIPWKFRPDQRKTRLIVKDYLRFQSQTKFYNWEIHQVMDRQGYISYIMRRPLSSGRYESLVVKDTTYNRLIDGGKSGPKVVESQDLKTLINRETLVFYTADGSTVSYLPSSIGNSVLTIQPGSANGRELAPIYLRGSICDRPTDISNEDAVQKKILNDRKQEPAAVAPSGGTGISK